MENLVAKFTDHNCFSSDVFYVEYVDAGSPEANCAAALQRHRELFGDFVSYDCEVCGSSWQSLDLLNWKQSRKVYRRWRARQQEQKEFPWVFLLSEKPKQ
ncbi:MAG: hypothetical protein K2W95_14575 [Candidatus Obscuribacterales bacterium]|nr:hypothetical protein [Candidatus Obscuribacterales bacterium]